MARILVTGGCSGLGAEITNALRLSGHQVIVYDVKEGVGHDVTNIDRDQLAHLVGEHKTLDGLINCAGINHNEWFEEVTPFSIHKVMEVNALGPVFMTQALLPWLERSKGFVCNIASNAASIPMTSSLAYNMSKAAALMATKQMAHELTPRHGITVFSISPNKLAGTGMSREIEANVCKVRGWTPEYAVEYQKKALMHGRETDPADLALFIESIVNNMSWRYMSGTDIPFGK